MEIIRRLYRDRFSKMMFIIPFHEDEDDADDVLTVYRGGFSFDGMVVDCRREIESRFSDCSHILFVHNDLLLSGRFSESTAAAILCDSTDVPFVTSCSKIEGPAFSWNWFGRLPYKIRWPMDGLMGTGAEKARSYFPSRSLISKNVINAGYSPESSYLERDETRLDHYWFAKYINQEVYASGQFLGPQERFDLEYPFFSGYSDVFCVPMVGFQNWVKTLGLLSSLDVFPEISIPTALIWTYGRLGTAKERSLDISILWGDRHLADSVEWVIERFRAGCDYIHPVKYEMYPEASYSRLLDELLRNEPS
jgi:hypothetical protein